MDCSCGCQEKIKELEESLRLTKAMLADTQRVLDVIPPCNMHGNRCIPHAVDWVGSMLSDEKFLRRQRLKYDELRKSALSKLTMQELLAITFKP